MPTTSPQTNHGTPRLSEVAKHLAIPSDIASTEWPAVLKTCTKKLGVTFDPWQEATGRLALAKRADGTLACMIDGVGLSLPRQVGKTYLLAAMIFALCVNKPGLLVIWSAHHARTHEETFLSMQAFAERAKVAPHVKKVYTGSGDEEVRFHNGSRILFGARERGFGRGIPGVDILVFDEAQILTDRALANMLATLNTSTFGLQLYVGTPPKPDDPSEAFTRMRVEAIAGRLTDGVWIEFGADDDATGEDLKQLRKANPSYPKRTPWQSLQRLKRKLTEADWLREGLGIWDKIAAAGESLISEEAWLDLEVGKAPTDGIRSFGVKFAADGSRVAVVGAMKRPDKTVHVELVGAHTGSMADGTATLVAWFTEGGPGQERWRNCASIVVDGMSAAGSFVNALHEAGVSKKVVVTPTWPDVSTGNGMLLEAVKGATVTCLATEGQSLLTASMTRTGKKMHGDKGAWSWTPLDEDADEIPAAAASLAHWGAKTSKRRPGRRQTGMVM